VESITILRLGRILNFMKSIIDLGMTFPEPASYQGETLEDIQDRMEMGRRIVAWFLRDGKIRGVDPKGCVYEHTISSDLSGEFIRGLRDSGIRGCRKRTRDQAVAVGCSTQ
jgi:hypothetical protein